MASSTTLLLGSPLKMKVGTYGMHLQPVFRERYGVADASLPNATRAHRSTLTIPLYPQLDDADMERVTNALRESVSAVRSV